MGIRLFDAVRIATGNGVDKRVPVEFTRPTEYACGNRGIPPGMFVDLG